MSFTLNGIKHAVQGVVLMVINLAKICFTWMWANFLLFLLFFFILSLVKKKNQNKVCHLLQNQAFPPLWVETA